MIDSEDRGRIEKRLLEEREEALEAIREFDESRAESLRDATGELTALRFHPADLATETMEQEKQFLLASNEGRRLYEIDNALRKLYREPEHFGVCERCGRDIRMERLEVVPSATMCADCQRITEEQGERQGS